MTETNIAPAVSYLEIPIEQLVESPWNPRKHWDQTKLEELTASVREKGVIEPIVVRMLHPHQGDPQFQIVFGSRRFRASKLAGRPTVPSVVRVLEDVEALEFAVIENGQREDVHPLDEAEGYQALLKADRAYNVAIVAAKVGKSESYVYRRLKLLQLEPDLLAALAEDRLSVAHAEQLLRLKPELRKVAANPKEGVVWRRSPLLEYGETWVPQREDLRPLNDLEQFIRTKSFFDPSHRDTRHFQPALAQQLEEAIDHEFTDTTDSPEAIDQFVSSLVLLTDDPMARMRLGAKKTDQIPLTPSQWREVKTPGARCQYTVRGVIVHGGEARVLDVCTKKSCLKHFPPVRKAKASSSKNRLAAQQATQRARDQREREARDRAAKEWEAMKPSLFKAFVTHTARAKVNADFVRSVVGSWDLKQVSQIFGVSLSDATAAQFLVLHDVQNQGTHHQSTFAAAAKTWGFDMKAFEKTWQAEQAAKGKAKLDDQREQLTGKKSTPAKKARGGK